MKRIFTMLGILMISVSSMTTYSSQLPEESKNEVLALLKDRGIISHQPFQGLHISSNSSLKGQVIIHRGDFMVSEVLTQFWNSSNWENEMLETYFYTAEGLLSEHLTQLWEAGEWVNGILEVYTYGSGEDPLSMLYQQWDPVESMWVDFAQATFTYDPVTELLMEVLIQINFGVWMNAFYFEFTYNIHDLVDIITYYEWVFESNGWEPNDKEMHMYDANLMLEQMLEQLYDGGSWVNDRHFGYWYNAEGKSTYTVERDWNENTNDWEFRYQYTNSYNGDGNLTHMLIELYTDAWVNSSQVTYTYDVNNNLITELEQYWIFPTGNREWVDQYLLSYNYSFVGIEDPSSGQTESTALNIYPNPVISEANILITTDNSGSGLLTILDNRGAKVYQQAVNIPVAGKHLIEWNIENSVPSGLYFVRFELNGSLSEGKVLVAR